MCSARIYIKIIINHQQSLPLLNPYGHQNDVWLSTVMVAEGRKVMCSDDYDNGDEDGEDGDGNSHDEDGDGNGDDVV